jgi:hypothetical protein
MHCLLGLQRDIEALAQKHFQKIPNALRPLVEQKIRVRIPTGCMFLGRNTAMHVCA